MSFRPVIIAICYVLPVWMTSCFHIMIQEQSTIHDGLIAFETFVSV